MILYHGTNCTIEQIDLEKCRPYKDFGKGFYLTTIREQAEKMANRVTRIYGGEPIVNVYEFDDINTDLRVKRFEAPTKEWAMFVIHNRNADADKNSVEDHNFDNRYDIVIGPVANDDLALLFRQFSSGMISVDILIREMEFKKLTNQYSFHTKEATALLRKVDEYIVKG
jgi:hypothetical protein